MAAHAMNFRDIRDQIVVCADSMVSDAYSSSEDATKWGFVADDVLALYSGTQDQAEDAVEIFKNRFKANPLTLADCKEQVYVAFQEFKEALKRRGLKNTDVELIIAGYVEHKPKIIYVSKSGAWSLPSYAAIGSGALVAEAMLRLRKPSGRTDSSEVMYVLYEAKKLGEASPHVGKIKTDLWVLEHYYQDDQKEYKTEWKELQPDGLAFLEDQFKKFGPQKYEGDPNSFPWRALRYPPCTM